MRILILLFLSLHCYSQIGILPIPAGFKVTTSGSFTVIATQSKIGIGSGTNTTSNTDCTGSNFISVVCNTYTGSSATAPTITDNQGTGNTYTLVRYDDDDVGGSGLQRRGTCVYYCYNPSFSTASAVTWSTTTAFTGLFVVAASGAVTSPLDAQNGNNSGGGTTVQPGSITPAQNGELLVVVAQGYTGSLSAPTISSGWTLIGSTAYVVGNSYSCGAWYQIQTTVAAINPTITWSVSETTSQASISSFKHP